MKLTKLQRHTAYIIMLAEMKTHAKSMNGSWFCYLICDLFGIDNDGFFENDDQGPITRVMRHFSELNRLFPPEMYVGHYDFKTRRKILKQCIEETY